GGQWCGGWCGWRGRRRCELRDYRRVYDVQHVRHRDGRDDAEDEDDDQGEEPQGREDAAGRLFVVTLLGSVHFSHARHLSMDVGLFRPSNTRGANWTSPIQASAAELVSLASVMKATMPTRGGRVLKSVT